MLTTEQIRTLNDARTILKNAQQPNTWSGGRVSEACDNAQDAIFDVLNATNSHRLQEIPETLLHNSENPDRTKPLGRAEDITVVGDEDGFELHFTTEDGSFVVNVHGVAKELFEATGQIGDWIDEGREARADRPVTDDSDAYDPSDPKHPGWSVRVADAYDTMRG